MFNFFIITRAWSFPITLIAVTLGTILAKNDIQISLNLYAGCLVAGLLWHATANTLNDYFDLKNKIDTLGSPTTLYRPHPVFAKLISEKKLLMLSITLLMMALTTTAFLITGKNPLLWIFAITGIFCAVGYTIKPFALKYLRLGETAVFLSFGPLIIGGTYFLQTSHFSWQTIATSIIYGLLSALVVFANNMRDLNFDKNSGIKTLAITLGPKKSMQAYTIGIFFPFILIAINIALQIFPLITALTFIALPHGLVLVKKFKNGIPITADSDTAAYLTTFSLLFILAFLFQ